MFINLSKEDYNRLYFVSDTHYSHLNICYGTSRWSNKEESTRKFDTIEEMNDAIVNNINNKVGENDILFHMGDLSFGGFENIKLFRDRIICKNIYFLIGNHDHFISKNKNNISHECFVKYADIVNLKLKNHNLVLCHFPIASYDGINKKESIHLHGHLHNKGERRFINKDSMDVGIDGNPNFEPYSFIEILEELSKNKLLPLVEEDHHLYE